MYIKIYRYKLLKRIMLSWFLFLHSFDLSVINRIELLKL